MARRDVPRAPSNPQKPQPRPKRRWLRRVVGWGAACLLLLAMMLGVTVFLAERSLPSFEELKETAAGQTIVVRARDG